MIVKTTTVQNKLGLHARAASKLVQVAQNYGSQITIRQGEQKANGKSIMSLLILQAAIGTELTIEVEGKDEAKAMKSILDLIADRFGEGE